MSVKITVPKGKKEVINASSKNAEFGYMLLKSEDLIATATGWMAVDRTCLMRNPIKILQRVLSKYPTMELPGRIVQKDYLFSQVPEDMKKKHLYLENDSQECFIQAVQRNIKRSGTEGPAYTLEGEPIVSFNEYDATGLVEDIYIAHDNRDEIAAYKAAMKTTAGASL